MRKKKRSSAKKARHRKTARAKKITHGRTARFAKRIGRRKASRGRTTARKKMIARGRRAVGRRETARKESTSFRRRFGPNWVLPEGRVPGPDTGGQSGDIEGLPVAPSADSESVTELLEEGQAFEAEAISGVENAPDADAGEVRTREVPEDDVPPEYRERD